MSAFVRYPLLGCLALFLSACGSSGSQTLLSSSTQTAGTTPEAMRGAILEIYQATTGVITTESYRVLGSGEGISGSCTTTWICTRYESSAGIVIKSAHEVNSGDTPEGFGDSFTPLGVSNGIQLGRITATATTGTGTDVTVMTTYYGGWLQNSFFAIVVDEFMEADDDQRIGTAFSQGEKTTTDPAALNGYDLTWKGRLFGLGHTTDVEGGTTRNNRIGGDVKITLDINEQSVDVVFEDLFDYNNSSNNSRLLDYDWEWTNLMLNGTGGFMSSTLEGQFYGDDHLEVGGTFDHNGIIGAFGAKRIKSTTTP